MLACRCCRLPLTAAEGCAVCLPIKPQLITTDEDEDTKPSLSDVGSEAVAGLRRLLRDSRALYADPRLEARERLAAGHLTIKVSNSLSKILEAARKLQTDGLSAIRNMSFLERAELFIGWYTALVPAYRANIRTQMDSFEATTNRALPASAVAQ